MAFNSEQEKFWATTYAGDYIKKNRIFDNSLGSIAWKLMLKETQGNFRDYLECGCNIGRNINQIKMAFPEAIPSIIEISKPAYEYVTAHHEFKTSHHGSILSSDFGEGQFDLVFTMGVLIHINPLQLLDNLTKIVSFSNRYVLIGEYFNRTPISIDYQGEKDKLFKRDFGKFFLENFKVKLVDYGFLWGHLYDAAGFDDITWWLFEKE